MSQEASPNLRTGFCIYIDIFFQGPVPIVSDGDDKYVVFETELEAQKEIADNAMIRLQQFLDGERDFDDAITVEEYVVPVTVHPNGTITDETGNCFGPSVE
jgi:phosphatidylserine decarboxylase